MAALIDKATMIVIGFLILIVIGGIIFGTLFFLYKKRKSNKMSGSEQEDYNELKRKDTKDFIKFEDICDDMIITEGGKRFIGVIRCKGTDFFSSHIAEKVSIQAGYRSFMQTISKPITYRQYTQKVDLELTEKKYAAALNKHKEILYNLEEDYKESQKYYLQVKAQGEKEAELSIYEKELSKLSQLIQTENWHIFHLEDQILYSGQIGGSHAIPKRNETYVFDWADTSLENSTEMSQEEIYQKAKKELKKISDAKIHALAHAKVRAYRCNTQELVEMCRRHTNPLSAERFKMSDIKKSTFYDDISTLQEEHSYEKECVEGFTMDVMAELQNEFDTAINTSNNN